MKYFSVALLVSIFSLAQAQYEFNSAPVDDCWVEIGSYCTGDFDFSRDLFFKEGTLKMQEINDTFQAQIEPLWLDNGAHANALVNSATEIYRTYEHCLSRLCDKILADCSANAENEFGRRNANHCEARRQDLLPLAQAQIKSTIVSNIDRKQRSLWVEKLKAISFRFDQYLYPRLRQMNREMAGTVVILALARLVR